MTDTSQNSETTNDLPDTSDADSKTLIGGTDKADEGTEVKSSFGETITSDALELPEGVTLDETQSTEFLELVNGAENRTDLANSILKMYASVSLAAAEAAEQSGTDAFDQMSMDWRDEIKADPEFGGKAEAESLATANVIVEKYGNREFTNALNLTGMGNNLNFLRFLMAVNADLPQQATPVTGNPASGSKSLADRLFASTN